MKFTIHPFEGVELDDKGLIEFGMHWSKVRQFFDEPHGRPGDSEGTYIDSWLAGSIQLVYDASFCLELCQFSRNAGISIFFREHELLNIPYIQLIPQLESSGIYLEPKRFTESLVSFDNGFAVGIAYPESDGESEVAPWVFVAKKGYPTISREPAAA
jgi:hypothetical protein